MSDFSFLNKTGCYKNRDLYIITRCPFCGDSKRHRYNHGHLYIYKDNWTFKCFRCGEYGSLKKLLIEYLKLNIINDKNKVDELINKYTSKQNLIYINTSSKLYIPKQRIISGYKLVYVSNRFNMKASEIDIDRYRLILDLTTFFKYNKILVNKYKLTDKAIKRLDDNYVGFLTKYSTKIVLRSVKDNVTPRYIQYGIKDNTLSGLDHYSIYNDYTIFRSKEIIIGEGIFDVNNTLLNKYFNEHIPRLAILGKARILSLHKLIKFIYMDKIPHLIYLIDADLIKDVKHVKYILSKCAYKVSIYKNVYDKDFGSKKIFPEKIF